MAFELGTLVRLSVAFTVTQGSAPVDPTTVELQVRGPDGSVSEYGYPTGPDGVVTKDSTGAYHYDLLPDAGGSWSLRWTGTGAAEVSTGDRSITVNHTRFP